MMFLVGDVKTTPARNPASILEPSKYITQLEYVLYSLGSSTSVHLVTKLVDVVCM